MTGLFWHSLETMLVLVLIGLAGYFMAYKGVLDPGMRRKFSQLLVAVFMPALILSQLLPAARAADWSLWWVLPAGAFVNIGLGLLFGLIPAWLGKRPNDRAVSMASMGFVNCGYVPMSLLAALGLSGNFISPEGDVGAAGSAMVAVYLTVFTPLLWLLGYNLIACSSLKDLQWRRCITVPGVAAIVTLICAFTPLGSLLTGENAPLKFVFCAAKIVGDAATPCAIVLLGANLAGFGRTSNLGLRYLCVFTAVKFLLTPLVAIGFLWLVLALGFKVTPLLALLLILEGCMPPGLNLIIICQVAERKLEYMTSLLFFSYLVAVPFLLFWLFMAQYLIGNFFKL